MIINSSTCTLRGNIVIEGSRLDNLEYLLEHNIDRNLVAQALSHIMSRMIYITGSLLRSLVLLLPLPLICYILRALRSMLTNEGDNRILPR
jgi:hypothetical protein